MAARPPAIVTGGGARLASTVYDQLKVRLLDGIYGAGQKLSVDELRSEFSVSKQPVMDALRSLAADGLVDIVPQVGCWVKSYSAHDVENFFFLISGIEENITGLAAVQRSEEQVRSLRSSWEWMAQLPSRFPEDELPSQQRLANREFHSIIHDMANSEIITSVSRRVWDLADFLQGVGGREPFRVSPEKRLRDHEEILNAIEAGDVDAARTAARDHMLHTGRMIVGTSPDSALQSS